MAGEIDDLGWMSYAPVYIHSGGEDMSMPPPNQKAQQGLMEHFGASVKYVYDAAEAHTMNSDRPGEALRHIFSNLLY